MSKEILEITPSGGIFCPVSFGNNRMIDCARAGRTTISDILSDIRLGADAETAFQTDGDILRWAFGLICDSGMGRSLAHDARFDGWSIQMENGAEENDGARIEFSARLLTLPKFAESNAVFARSQPARMQFLFEAFRGLRMIWQENTDIRRMQDLSARELISRERFCQADADICALLSAYQLRETGYYDLWRYGLSTDLNPLAATMADCLDFDFTSDGILEAMGFIFPDWFADDERLSAVDYRTLSLLEDRALRPFGMDAIGLEEVIQLGTLPDGFSYLEYSASDMLTENYYARLPDPIIRAHLGQIVKEANINIMEDIGFRDINLARKIFPQSSYDAIV